MIVCLLFESKSEQATESYFVCYHHHWFLYGIFLRLLHDDIVFLVVLDPVVMFNSPTVKVVEIVRDLDQ